MVAVGRARQSIYDPAMMTPERELWAVATLIEQQQGNDAPVWIAQRISELALAGDMAGVERWKAIAGKLDQLRRGSDIS